MFSVENLKAELSTEFLGINVIYLPATGSTNSDAWEHLDKDSQEGTLFVTDHQQDGRGRRQNKWASTPGKSLTFSFILYPQSPLDQFGLFPLLTGVSIIKGIESAVYIKPGLKWPNDIMLSRKKMGGILIESKSTSDGLAVVVGVGLNINETDQDFPEPIKNHATSLKIYLGEDYSREHILAEILNEFEQLYTNQWGSIISNWYKYCIHEDSAVSFHTEEGKYEGVFQGIAANGHAEIMINGEIKRFPSGMITL